MPTPTEKASWSLNNAPRLDEVTAIVTGSTGGLGYETAFGLAQKGATVVLAGRNPAKGAQAVERVTRAVPGARVRFEPLDLASLASVAQFAEAVAKARGGVIDILVNNAGVMGLPKRQLTRDGFEQQIGVNYLGHFALTALLKDALCSASGGGRVVNVASLAHRRGVLALDDLQSAKSYDPMRTYRQSKLAMLAFAIELQRRAERNQWPLRSYAAHPGWARTEIIGNGPGSGAPGLKERLLAGAFDMMAQSARDGALPMLYAAMAPEAVPGAYYGPTNLGETRGPPGPARVFPQAMDTAASARLWALSEQLTGTAFG